jgi:hypothetical protein
MRNMGYVHQNSGFSLSDAPGRRQNGDGWTTCPMDPLNMLANLSAGRCAGASAEHVWAANSRASMPAAASELAKFYRPMTVLDQVALSFASNDWGSDSSGGTYPAGWADAVWAQAAASPNMAGIYLDDFHDWDARGVAELAALKANLSARSAQLGRRLESYLTVYTSEMPGGSRYNKSIPYRDFVGSVDHPICYNMDPDWVRNITEQFAVFERNTAPGRMLGVYVFDWGRRA